MSPRDASDHLRDYQNRIIAERIAHALERLAPPPAPVPDFAAAEAFIWQAHPEAFLPVAKVNRLPLPLLRAVAGMRDTLLANTERFARGLPANNALLWGARGMGKSSLVKAVHAEVRAKRLNGSGTGGANGGGEGQGEGEGEREEQSDLKLVEIHREDIATLPRCLAFLRDERHRFIVFCDDLSFDADDTSYKSLKAVLEGGIEGRPENVLFYATSNRRHLLPRDMLENERSTAISPHEAVEEKVSLSDRFGLWIGFHNCSQADFLEMVRAYADHYRLKLDRKQLDAEAHAWAMARGSRSGRVAWQFIQDLAGREGVRLE